ncbi:MAG TPA: DUF1156 domain-containing protein, partial [Alphaproteobacteria bacterium]|nr:DUF1156 domain-containing protein [Alphaproteobacteria bacterium]
LHLWWARRPLATARAVLFAQLVDDPSVRYDEFRQIAVNRGDDDPEDSAEQMVAAERQRLFDILERLVVWENIGDEALYAEARAEIMRSTNNSPPAILDPFAGGGTIPLEAQRLGLEAHASDLNPVAVLINKALIEIPPKFAGRPPVFPGAAEQRNDWPRATGLAEDVRRYGEWMRDEAEKRIGHLYPKAKLPGGGEATVIAWIWARTVTCPNPACGIEMPLVRSWWLGKKKGKEAYVVPSVSGGKVKYDIGHDPKHAPTKDDDGTMSGRKGAICVSCATAVPTEYIKEQGIAGRLGAALIATVAEGNRQRIYVAPTPEHVDAADVPRPEDVPDQKLGYDPRNLWTPTYGLDTFASLFTNRQLTALTTFSDLVAEARDRVLADARAAGLPEGIRLESGGTDAAAYADAVATYLGLATSRCADYFSTINTWASTGEFVRNVFSRQALPMAWDFAETNPMSDSTGNFRGQVAWTTSALERTPAHPDAEAQQADAASRSYANLLVSTDPPYYDNIGYSDLSDYFYVWLRRSLRPMHPSLLGTMLVPKADELVANPYRHGGQGGAQQFFENGFEHVFEHARLTANNDYPIAVYYAFKQSEVDGDGEGSKGWETILGSMVRAGWVVTATWPARSEKPGRSIAVGTAALA